MIKSFGAINVDPTDLIRLLINIRWESSEGQIIMSITINLLKDTQVDIWIILVIEIAI
jgi:hypothetical protein